MQPAGHFTHVLDDQSLGGVTRALANFSHADIRANGKQEISDLLSGQWRTSPKGGIAILHFTASWKKLRQLVSLRRSGRFSKIVLIEHTYTQGFEANCVSHQKRFRLMLKLAYHMVECVVAVSHSQRHWMLEAKLARPEKIIAIAQARDCSHLFDLPIATPFKGPLRIGAFGRFHEQKGFDLLIKAMADISPSQCTLKIAGYGADQAKLEAMAAPLSHVTLKPAFKCPRQFLSGIDVVAIPSRWEAFGLVGAEARAAGRPIIAANIDGLKDQIGNHSWSHRMGDVADIRRVILAAANARDIAKRAEAARAHVSGEFQDMIAGWARLQAELMSG